MDRSSFPPSALQKSLAVVFCAACNENVADQVNDNGDIVCDDCLNSGEEVKDPTDNPINDVYGKL